MGGGDDLAMAWIWIEEGKEGESERWWWVRRGNVVGGATARLVWALLVTYWADTSDTDQAAASGPGSGFANLKPGPEACKAASKARPGSGFYGSAAGA